MKERPAKKLFSSPAKLPAKPLADEQVKQALDAMKAAQELRQQIQDRRAGKELAPSWPLIRVAREERAARDE
jgi:hypothetical protein